MKRSFTADGGRFEKRPKELVGIALWRHDCSFTMNSVDHHKYQCLTVQREKLLESWKHLDRDLDEAILIIMAASMSDFYMKYKFVPC
jgi:hypothetical protein